MGEGAYARLLGEVASEANPLKSGSGALRAVAGRTNGLEAGQVKGDWSTPAVASGEEKVTDDVVARRSSVAGGGRNSSNESVRDIL